jgi:hypothetical protein
VLYHRNFRLLTPRWATDPGMNSSNRLGARPNLGAQHATVELSENKENNKKISTRPRRTGTQMPSPPQTPTLARRCKDVEIKSETVPKAFVAV